MAHGDHPAALPEEKESLGIIYIMRRAGHIQGEEEEDKPRFELYESDAELLK